MLECPISNPMRDLRMSFKGTSNIFFQLDHQDDISLYLTKATAYCYFRELASLEPLYVLLVPLASPAPKTTKSI